MLSFSENKEGEQQALKLGQLNVLIGPNGSGKSNLIEIISLLKALPKDLEDAFLAGGGFFEWFGKRNTDSYGGIELKIRVDQFHEMAGEIVHLFSHYDFDIVFQRSEQSFFIGLEHFSRRSGDDPEEAVLLGRTGEYGAVYPDSDREIDFEIDTKTSILTQIAGPDYPHFNHLRNFFSQIAFYRNWTFGRYSHIRSPQKTDARNDLLKEDFSNLGMFLNRLRKDPRVKRRLIRELQNLYQGLDDFEIIVEGGTVQIFLTEGEVNISASRLSDGTLRYLALLAILLDPTPPPLICIEEPELGLHPDIVPELARILKEASEKTQIIVTTHSDILIDAMSDIPEAVLVCEKVEGFTQIKRLSTEDLKSWLEEYQLGQLWSKGVIGGNRW